MTEQLLTPSDLGDKLAGIPAKTVLELRRRYGWPYVEVGRRIRFTAEQAEAIVRMQTRIERPAAALDGQTALSQKRGA